MKVSVRPELPIASIASLQAPTAAMHNSASSVIRPKSTYKSGKVVQTTGATSNRELKRANEILRKASAFFAQAELDRRPK